MEGFFKEKTTVTITADVEGARIYYTLDGTLPSDQSIPYETPFMLDRPAIVRAVVYRDGQAGSIADAFIRVLPEGICLCKNITIK